MRCAKEYKRIEIGWQFKMKEMWKFFALQERELTQPYKKLPHLVRHRSDIGQLYL